MGNRDALDRNAIEAALGEGWTYDGDAIQKSYRFDDFTGALGFINRVGAEAEQANHHPEIHNVYNQVDLSWSTHDVGAVTQLDLDMAAACDAAAG